MHLWGRLILQATPTLNLPRPSHINPHLYAKTQLNGAFDFNRTPLAPPDTKVLVFEAPGILRTCSPHGVTSWYIGSATEHYRCYPVYIPKNRAERIVKTVDFFPHDCPVPKISSADDAVNAARALTDALANPMLAPFAQIGDAQLQTIQKLDYIFDHPSQQSTSVPPFTRVAWPAPVPSTPLRLPVHTTPSPRVPLSPTTLQMPLHRPPRHLIELDHDNLVAHCYPLRSQHSIVATRSTGLRRHQTLMC